MSAAPLDSRLAHLEGAFDQIVDRLNSVDRRFDSVERRLDDLARRFDGLVSRMDKQFMWLMGIMIVSILLPVVEHFSTR
jgi:hypothetical protein